MSPNPPRARKQPSKAGCVCRLNLSGFRRPDGSSCSDDARDSDGGGSKDVHAFNPLRCRIFRFSVGFFVFLQRRILHTALCFLFPFSLRCFRTLCAFRSYATRRSRLSHVHSLILRALLICGCFLRSVTLMPPCTT